MTFKKSFYIILALGILFTVIIQLDITRAIFLRNYLNTRQISGVNYYLSMINESSKGNWTLGSPYLLEWRYAPYLNPSLSFNIAGLFKRSFGLDIKSYAMIMGYFAVFITMALILAAFGQIFRFSYFGYLAAAAYIFFPRVIMWNRTWSPEINFIPLALFFVFYFWPAVETAPLSRLGIGAISKFWKRELSLAFLAGILFYVYPYYWTFALALLAISDFLEFWNRKKIIWKHIYKYAIIAGLASGYVFHLWKLYQLPYYKESLVRIGFLYSRLPAGWYTQAVLLASLGLFWMFKKYVFSKINFGTLDDGAWNKIIAGLITGLVVLNQQLITGMQMEFNSHYAPIILFFVVALWGGLVFLLINNLSFYYKYILILSSFILVASFGIIRIYAIAGGFDSDIYIGGRADNVVNWFLDNKIQDKVVYAPMELGDEINLWTNNYLVWHDSQALQLTPTEELINRFTYFDVTNQYLTDNLLKEQGQIFNHTFDSKLQKDDVINKIKSKLLGRDFVPANLADYVEYDFGPMYEKRTHPDIVEFKKYLEKYHVDYLVYSQKDKNSIYKDVTGKIVFSSEEEFASDGNGAPYLIKKRE